VTDIMDSILDFDNGALVSKVVELLRQVCCKFHLELTDHLLQWRAKAESRHCQNVLNALLLIK
jgi:hypothetical protein